MTFRIVKQPHAWWPVEWPGVAEDGAMVTNAIDMRFRLLKIEEATEFLRDVTAAQEADRRATAEALGRGEEAVQSDIVSLYSGLVSRIAVDWRGLEAENGEPLPFDGDKWLEAVLEAKRLKDAGEDAPAIPVPAEGGQNLRALMNEPKLFTHVFQAFQACIEARPKVREGN